jgi:hypothetical protein
MDNDIFIPFKFRASQIVGLSKVLVKTIETTSLKLKEEKTSAIAKLNTVGWYDAAEKARERITGYLSEDEKTRNLFLEILGKAGETWFNFTAPNGNEGILAGITAYCQGPGLEEAVLQLWDSQARSKFLQVPSVGKRLVNFGTATAEWPGGSGFSKPLKFAHGLGVAPKVVVAVANSATIASPLVCDPRNYDATFVNELYVWATAGVPAAGSTAPVQWAAFA